MVFDGYKRDKGDIVLKAENDRVIYHKNDILLAVNGEDNGGRTLDDVSSWIKTLTDETIKMTSLYRTLFNSSDNQSVRKG